MLETCDRRGSLVPRPYNRAIVVHKTSSYFKLISKDGLDFLSLKSFTNLQLVNMHVASLPEVGLLNFFCL